MRGQESDPFCTYALKKGGTLNVLEKELTEKGCSTILSVSKRGFKPSKADFSDVFDEITKVMEEQT